MTTGTTHGDLRPHHGGGDEPRRQRDRGATEARILDCAARLFAEQGYRTVTVRTIATAAGVNVALINRYFGSKLGLFDAVLGAGATLPRLNEVPFGELPRYLAEYALRRRQRSATSSRALSAATRSVESPEIRELLRERLEKQLIGPLAARLPEADARRKAALCVAVLIGTGYVRGLLADDTPPDPAFLDHLTEVFGTCLR